MKRSSSFACKNSHTGVTMIRMLDKEEKVLLEKLRQNDPLWHVQLIILLAIILQLTLPFKFVAGPRYVLPILEGILLFSLLATAQKLRVFMPVLRRINAVGLIFLISIANIYALQRLSHELLLGGKVSNGHSLIRAAINIYLTNIIVFGLLYWEIDGGGPLKRTWDKVRHRDFLFPQMADPKLAPREWIPGFIDYLYVSATNATAFSPTDTMPLTRTAKLLMLIQSLVSLTTLGLVAARAVNILS